MCIRDRIKLLGLSGTYVQMLAENIPNYRVSLPLCTAVIEALHKAVDDQANAATFHGYMPEIGSADLRHAIEGYYHQMGVCITENEIFVSSGACDDLGDILELFDRDNTVMVIEPAYPEYVDTNILAGRKIIHLASGRCV